ncbi:membrane-bound O-acyltransferase family protein [Bordetella genomosp. 9]|uniref:Probable alginate O-acetylase AlgI n=1 Tax=Bordetella genomosp. 9 TaxID=1416803 RepID=A0A261R807_9BORD|nr:MBOAT family O-acyltransferase [Bordetella genomosp. 9]OZI21145.1 membrane-bound O-acyltransferase family protein [Bordetella genomosp. 9]
MVFASLEFLTLFLPAFLILYVLAGLGGGRAVHRRNAVLLFSSWVFYGWWSPVFLLLFIALTLLGWLGGILIDKAGDGARRGWMLALLIAIALGTLCWYKYANILVETLNTAIGAAGGQPIGWERVILPIGLSFIVLQSISYLIDVYRRTVPADYSFITFGAYQAMFVHLIAGPIIRYDWVKRELVARTVDWPQFALGARRFMIGMSMKVLIADTLAPLVDTAFALPHPTLADAWLGCLGYTLQLFFDFAGYSAMAIGLGLMLGFHFPENFLHPYLARSIQDFWRRWHISLSTWLRDYLYIPLGGNRGGVWRTYRNLLLTMAIAGLWHGGDSWNFLLWGIAHGLALCAERLWLNSGLPPLPSLPARVLTLLFVMLAWTIFRAHTFDGALTMYAGQFGLHGVALGDEMRLALRPVHVMTLVLGVCCAFAPALAPWAERHRNPLILAAGALWPVLGFLFSFALIASRGAVPFLYFQF